MQRLSGHLACVSKRQCFASEHAPPQSTNVRPRKTAQNSRLNDELRREAPKHRRFCGLRRLRRAYFCDFAERVNRKSDPLGSLNCLFFLRKTGAGEGIRTLDPNLGKVVLYP